MHVCVEDAAGAKSAIQQAGLTVSDEQEALITAVEDTPGSGGKLLRRLADAGVNLKAVYLATNTRVVIAGDKLEQAKQQLQAGVGAPQAHT